MGKIAKSRHYLLLTCTFLLLLVNCVFINPIYQNEIISTYECCDFSEQCEHSHTYSLEDDVLYIEKIVNPYKLEIQKDFLVSANSNFKNSFNSQIWKPPKNS
jgi:hypothetical protein